MSGLGFHFRWIHQSNCVTFCPFSFYTSKTNPFLDSSIGRSALLFPMSSLFVRILAHSFMLFLLAFIDLVIFWCVTSHSLVRYCQFHENKNETNKDNNHHQIKAARNGGFAVLLWHTKKKRCASVSEPNSLFFLRSCGSSRLCMHLVLMSSLLLVLTSWIS